MQKESKEKKIISRLPQLTSEDIRDSRERVDKAFEIFRETTIFTKEDFDTALRKVSRRIGKPKSSPEPSET